MIKDIVDEETKEQVLTIAECVMIKKDEIFDFYWYYFRSDNEEFNNMQDPKLSFNFTTLLPSYSKEFMII